MQDRPQHDDDNIITIPPFVDAHMHFTVEGRPASGSDLKEIINTCRRSGILSLRDMGHKSGIGFSARKNSPDDFHVITCGHALFRKGGYGAFLGMGIQGKEEIRQAVCELSDAGADFLKVVNSGIVLSRGPGLVSEGGFSSEELRIICEEARQRGLDVYCHANSDRAIRDAVAAGAASIEHGFFISRQTIAMMAEKGVSWTPTAFALLSIAPGLALSERTYVEEVVEKHLESIYYAASLGLKLQIGTDSGSKGMRHGKAFFEELRLFKKAGLPFDKIISAACMSGGEMEKGSFLVVRRDFISSGFEDQTARHIHDS
jgi:hypothetical protein